MQTNGPINILAWTLIIIGSIIIISGIVSMIMKSHSDSRMQGSKSKGIILLGPIPIVWGYGKRAWVIAAIVAVSLFLLAILWR
ncbi:MAG: DUF131 domain-containing protein [Candidatus Thorarchaeota archaeon]|nr:DUF131 domain-containing protein [Candidatus Thorarchaeota archaeon]